MAREVTATSTLGGTPVVSYTMSPEGLNTFLNRQDVQEMVRYALRQLTQASFVLTSIIVNGGETIRYECYFSGPIRDPGGFNGGLSRIGL